MDSNICPICFDKLEENEDKVKLTCGHCFHYDCILLVYKNNVQQKKYNVRKCPYCRSNGGYLKYKVGGLPIANIHREYDELKKNLEKGNFNMIEKYLIKDKCHAILKSGINKGNQCSRNKCEGKNFCKTHLKIYDS